MTSQIAMSYLFCQGSDKSRSELGVRIFKAESKDQRFPSEVDELGNELAGGG